MAEHNPSALQPAYQTGNDLTKLPDMDWAAALAAYLTMKNQGVPSEMPNKLPTQQSWNQLPPTLDIPKWRPDLQAPMPDVPRSFGGYVYDDRPSYQPRIDAYSGGKMHPNAALPDRRPYRLYPEWTYKPI